MKVLKFGGTSVGSAENINKVIAILETYAAQAPLVCVVSAVGGITDKLLLAGNLAQQKQSAYEAIFSTIKTQHLDITQTLIPNNNQAVLNTLEETFEALKNLLDGIYLINELSNKTSDKLVSYGELLSSYIIAETMKARGIDCERKNSQELLVTDSNFSKAEIHYAATNQNIKDYFASATQSITLLPGFVAKSQSGEPTTLGRGGSDFTAAIVAAALQADLLEIWTDVSGMFTANPKLVKQAFPIERLSYQEAMELSHFGAKVLYPPTVQPVLDKDIPIVIKNTLEPEAAGTYITREPNHGNLTVRGISH
ncbi:MAG TPA: aspartate kinase, partial [Flavobacteriaceae bacterium]|nr:aspartate kinase [Flavobacteriaceae bacterium]